MLSLNKLEIFMMVVQVGSFSKAADNLYMSQSAISQHISDLENHLGTTLFKRGSRGVTPTAQGDILYEYTQKILHLVAEAESAVTNVENLTEGQVSIGSTPGVSVYLLPEWIHSFRARYPQLTAALQTNITPTIIDGVLSHKLDIGFVEGEIDGRKNARLGQLVLEDVNLFVVIGRGHPCWNQTSIPIENLNGQPFITRQVTSRTRIWMDSILEAHDIKPHIVAELDNPESIKRAVISGVGVTILPEYAIHYEVENEMLRALPLKDLPLQRSLKVVWDRGMTCSPATRALILHLSHQFPQLLRVLESKGTR